MTDGSRPRGFCCGEKALHWQPSFKIMIFSAQQRNLCGKKHVADFSRRWLKIAVFPTYVKCSSGPRKAVRLNHSLTLTSFFHVSTTVNDFWTWWDNSKFQIWSLDCWSFWYWNRNIRVRLSQYNGCRCTGSSCCQGISNHGIEYAG